MDADTRYNMAIETSSAHGSIALGRGDELLEVVELAEQRRHAVELLPAMDRLWSKVQGPRSKVGEVGKIYVSVGPGSFTGLRVGVTTAKTIAYATGARLVAVPTLSVVAANAPRGCTKVAVMLNAKGGRWFTGVYQGGEEAVAPTLMTPEQLREIYEGPVICDGEFNVQSSRVQSSSAHDAGQAGGGYDWPVGLCVLDPSLAVPRAETVWAIGRAMAREGRFVEAAALVPLYVRLPDAEELWQTRNPKSEI